MGYDDRTTTEALGGRYVLQARVGSGRTTTVFAADDALLERRVAVKLFHDVPDEGGVAHFEAETQVLAGLFHPGLVPVYDVNLDADRPYMVMRLIDGSTLSDRVYGEVHREPLTPAEVARLGAQLADVLAYVHERGVVHGDLDARNVLVDKEDNGHLTGFGVDRGLGRPSGDVYALGMMLAGCLPPGLGPEWNAVLGLMTDADPEERPDAFRCGELLRNIESGSTSEFALPRFAPAHTPAHTSDEDEEPDVVSEYESEYDPEFDSSFVPDFGVYEPDAEPDPDERPGKQVVLPAKAGKHKQRMRPVAYTGLAGMGLAVAALAVVLATVSTDETGQRTGDQPQVEQPSDGTHIQPPGQSYPQDPDNPEAPQERGEARNPDPDKPPARGPGKPTTSPPSSSTTTTTPPPEGGPGNGNGNGQDNGNRRKSLLEIILGL